MFWGGHSRGPVWGWQLGTAGEGLDPRSGSRTEHLPFRPCPTLIYFFFARSAYTMRCCVPTRCTGQRPTQSDSVRGAGTRWRDLGAYKADQACILCRGINKPPRLYVPSFFFFHFRINHRVTRTQSAHASARTHRPQIFHSSPCGQTHLRGNVAESDSEQFLMARLSHYAVLRHACVCVRYVQVRVTTYYEGPAARSLDGVGSDRRAGDVGDRLWLVWQEICRLLVVDVKVF